MAYALYETLDLWPLKKSKEVFTTVDASIVSVAGIADNVMVNIGKLIIPTDFHVIRPTEGDKGGRPQKGAHQLRVGTKKIEPKELLRSEKRKEAENPKNDGSIEKGLRITPPQLRKKRKKVPLNLERKKEKKKKKQEEGKSEKKSCVRSPLWCARNELSTQPRVITPHNVACATPVVRAQRMCCTSTISAPQFVACAIPMMHGKQRKRSGKGIIHKGPWVNISTTTSLEIRLYETPAHEERGKILEERKALHERTIKFPEGEDTFEEMILARGWGFMYEPSILINLSWVREFYANKTKKDQWEIFLGGRKITCSVSTIEKTLGIPKFRGKHGYSEISEAYNNKTLNMDEVLQVIGKEGATW
ncbi:hypothetical protein PIB30_066924 [Stylosanthes scabra]|uniref:Uncharacterized protein n=1 Tax=Stylosanthes scabra TaxID=79078 RepID=A0ABU6TMA4_9FABA|nr:hypothetical protein [Stylosanthes scabra]